MAPLPGALRILVAASCFVASSAQLAAVAIVADVGPAFRLGGVAATPNGAWVTSVSASAQGSAPRELVKFSTIGTVLSSIALDTAPGLVTDMFAARQRLSDNDVVFALLADGRIVGAWNGSDSSVRQATFAAQTPGAVSSASLTSSGCLFVSTLGNSSFNLNGSLAAVDAGALVLPSASPTASVTPSATSSPSSSPSLSGSRTASGSVSPSRTGSSSITPSRTGSGTVTQSRSASLSATASRTPSGSGSSSAAATASVSSSPSPSTAGSSSESPSHSAAASASASSSASISNSASESSSVAASSSVSPSATGSPSVTASVAASPSATSSSSPTASSSSSATASATGTSSVTASVSQSPSATGTPTPGALTGVVTTVAGTSSTGSTNGASWTSSSFTLVHSALIDPVTQDVIVTEWLPSRIRKLSAGGGAVTTLAGSSTQGYLDGTGAAAQFNALGSIVFDSTTDTYLVADVINDRLRRVTRAGVVTTFVGSGSATTVDGTGTGASLNGPRFMTSAELPGPGLVFFVAESGGCSVRQVTPAGVVSTIYTHACGVGGLYYATGIVWSAADSKLYIADAMDHTIKSLTLGGTLAIVAGATTSAGSTNGALLTARFNGPHGMAISPTGTLIVADRGNSVLREVSIAAGTVTTLAGAAGATTSVDGNATTARFDRPMDISFAPHVGYMLVGEHESGKVRKIT